MAMDPVSTSEAIAGSDKPQTTTPFSLLGTSRLLPLFLAQSLGAFNVAFIASSLAVGLSSSSVARIALAFCVFLAPFVLFADIAGQVADKYDKARLTRILKALEIPVMGIACLGFVLKSVVLLICALGLLALLLAFFTPGRHAILPHHLSEEDLPAGNALLAVGTFVALLAGAWMGVVSLGEPSAWTPYVGLAIAAMGYAASRRIPDAAASDPGLELRFSPFSGLVQTIRFARDHRNSLFPLLGLAWFWISNALVLIQLSRTFGPAFGGLAALLFVGVVAGLVLSERISDGFAEFGLVPVGAIGQVVFALDLAFLSPESPLAGGAAEIAKLFETMSSWRVFFDLFALGVCGGFLLLPLYVQVQTRTKVLWRGRFVSLGVLLCAVALPIAGAVALALSRSVAVFAILAICSFLVAAFAYRHEAHLTLRFLTWLLIHAFYRVGKKGFEHIPRNGPAVLVCNHVSFVDSIIIMAAIRRPIRFVMDHRIHQTPVVGFLFRHSRTIPIATAKEDPAMKEAAFEEVARALRNGELIGLFPEGRITHTGEINHFRYGVGRIVAETPVPVVPMALRGLWGSFFSRRYGPAMSKPLLLRWQAKVELVVGETVPPEKGSPEYLQEIVTELRGGMV